MWAATKGMTYHAVYQLNGEWVAVCNKRISATHKARDIDPDTMKGRRVVGTAKVCSRCKVKNARPHEQEKRPESRAKGLVAPDPTVISLLAAGYDDATHHLARMADVVRGWLAEEVDPFEVGGMLDIIASKHAR